MSNKNSNIFDIQYDSYGGALSKYLVHMGFSRKWLAERIISEGVKLSSLQSQITRWTKGSPVSDKYKKKIDNALDITIKKNKQGKFNIIPKSRSQNEKAPALKAVDADQVDLGQGEGMSRDQMRVFLEQIELLVRTLKDNL